MTPGPTDALLVVDLQCDFLPGGSLAVAGGDRVVDPINHLLDLFDARGLPIYASRDWHPADHCSFRSRGGAWPVHCVAGSAGAAFAGGLRLPARSRVISKATRPDSDSYSAFGGTDLARLLRDDGVTRLFVAGLATDYCVLHTVADALAAGFAVVVVRDAVSAVDVRPGDGERAIAHMRERGAVCADTAQILDGASSG